MRAVNDSETNLSFSRYGSPDRRRRNLYRARLEKMWFHVFHKHYNEL